MRSLRNRLLLTALVTIVSANTTQAQLRLNKLRGRGVQANQGTSQAQSSPARRNGQTKVATREAAVPLKRNLPKHDLGITGLRGADDSLMTTVQNQGFVTSPATQLKIVVKDRITGQIRATKTARVNPIEPNRVARVRMSLLPLGNSIVFATVDPNNQIVEANEQNNSQSATFGTNPVPTDPNQRADLIVSGLQAKGNQLVIQVTNAGRAPSGAALVNIVIRGRDGRLQSTKSGRVQALKVGHIGQLYIRNLVLDDVKVTVTVDPENRVPERNERNNTKQLTVANQTQFAPDLIITDIMFKRQQKEVWFAVRNVGPVAQTQDVSLTLKSYFGPGNVVERTSKRISRLNTGQTAWQRWTVERLNSGMQFEGVLDVSNRLPEQNENNNRRVATFN